jgi:chromosome segregation ATPase
MLASGAAGAAAQEGAAEPDAEAIAMIRAELTELETQREILAAEVAEATRRAASFRDMLAALEQEKAGLERDAAAAGERLDRIEADIADGQAALEALRREVEEAVEARNRAVSEAAERDRARQEQSGAEALAAEAEARDALRALEARVEAARREQAETAAALAAQREEMGALDAARMTAESDVEALEARRRDLEAQVAAAARVQAEAEAPLDEPDGEAAVAPEPEPEPAPEWRDRASEAVEAVLAAAPGLGEAEPDRLAALAEELAGGGCVVPALRGALGRANRVTAAALIRELGDCREAE